MAWAHAKDLAPHGATSVSITPGWLRSEMMLERSASTEENWRDATAKVPHFVISETPRFVGRAVAALAADPDRARWNGQSLSSGGLAKVYGFTDLDGSRPMPGATSWKCRKRESRPTRPAIAERSRWHVPAMTDQELGTSMTVDDGSVRARQRTSRKGIAPHGARHADHPDRWTASRNI